MSRRCVAPVTSAPSKTTRPARNFNSPKIALNAVDLPAPLGPMTVVIAPRGALNEAPSRIVISP
jgi:hypothetical protein